MLCDEAWKHIMKVWSNESSRRLQFGITGQVTLLYLQLCSVHQPDQTNNQQSNAMENLTSEQRKKMESWKGGGIKYLKSTQTRSYNFDVFNPSGAPPDFR